MAQQTMSEIDAFRSTFENEYKTTRKLLHAYPASKAGMKPHEKAKSAQELAWMLTLNQMILVPALSVDELTGSGLPGPPATWNEVLSAFDAAHKETAAKISGVSESKWNSPFKMPVGPKEMGSMLRGQAMWMFLYDSIHHRGQFSTYLRMAGAKVPSIYGPTADEPWF